jgi:hypothetical protein
MAESLNEPNSETAARRLYRETQRLGDVLVLRERQLGHARRMARLAWAYAFAATATAVTTAVAWMLTA